MTRTWCPRWAYTRSLVLTALAASLDIELDELPTSSNNRDAYPDGDSVAPRAGEGVLSVTESAPGHN
jgi:hypothetical protein